MSSSSNNTPGSYDDLPPYEEGQKDTTAPSSSKNVSPDAQQQPTEHIVQLTINYSGEESTGNLLTTIKISPTTTYEDFQRQIKHRYLELARAYAGSFGWSTWLWGGQGRPGESEDREYIDPLAWEASLRGRILDLAQAEKLGWKGRPCRLEAVVRGMFVGKALKAKNAHQLQRLLRVHEGNERGLLMQGRHVPAPCLQEEGCCLM